jgi:hypothetical protein
MMVIAALCVLLIPLVFSEIGRRARIKEGAGNEETAS